MSIQEEIEGLEFIEAIVEDYMMKRPGFTFEEQVVCLGQCECCGLGAQTSALWL